jgi:hypothetical protein
MTTATPTDGDAKAWKAWLEAVLKASPEPLRHRLAIRRIDRLLRLQRVARAAGHSHGVTDVIRHVIAALEHVRRYHEARIAHVACVDAAEAAKSMYRALDVSGSAAAAAEESEMVLRAAVVEQGWSSAYGAQPVARSARWAALSASFSVRSAAESAAEVVEETAPESARWAAESARWAAESAAEVVEETEVDTPRKAAARAEAWKQEAADLRELLAEMSPYATYARLLMDSISGRRVQCLYADGAGLIMDGAYATARLLRDRVATGEAYLGERIVRVRPRRLIAHWRHKVDSFARLYPSMWS